MYDFHYNTMLPYFGKENLDLLFTDTDSLCYHIKNKDPFEFMANNKKLFDLSEYPEDHPLYDPTNKKVIGKFKNESINAIIEFCGLRSKLYAYSTDNNIIAFEKGKPIEQLKMKCKGASSVIVKKDIRLENYKTVLFSRGKKDIDQRSFRSYGHKVYTELINKIALSSCDDKIHVMDNNIDTLSFGHHSLMGMK